MSLCNYCARWSEVHHAVSGVLCTCSSYTITTFPMASSPLSNFIFRLFSGTRGFSYEAQGLVGACSSSFSGLSLCVSSSLSIPVCSSPWDAFRAAEGFWTRLDASWPSWAVGASGLFNGGQCSAIEAGRERPGGLLRVLDWLGGRTDEGFAWSRFPACSQRFFRALRFADRWVGALSKDCGEDKQRLKSENAN